MQTLEAKHSVAQCQHYVGVVYLAATGRELFIEGLKRYSILFIEVLHLAPANKPSTNAQCRNHLIVWYTMPMWYTGAFQLISCCEFLETIYNSSVSKTHEVFLQCMNRMRSL